MKLIVNAIRDKTNLIHFDYVQYGVSLNDGILNDLRKQLEFNKETLLKTHSNKIIDSIMDLPQLQCGSVPCDKIS